ncbi:MAG: dTDP-4-dehydrorhamnose 3,5-epimerase family protein [Candidatus Aureabacteria bacterium]|nr:dTDP-4-dehydrorhamnose 3,5-epimerase family protein [Candidatus Auribacterota bacterium]
MIDGIKIKQLVPNADERGYLQEIIRCDEEFFGGFGQLYVSLNNPGVVRAWHYHKKQADYITVIKGMAKVVVYDGREDSTTFGEINEFFVGEHHRILIRIPELVMHGYKTIGTEPCLLINLPTKCYNRAEPDEYRIPPHDNDIPYDWALKEH